MAVFKVRQSSLRLKSNSSLPSIFEFINQNTTSFRQPNRKCFATSAAATLIAFPRTHSKAPFSAYLLHQNRNCSSARLLTSPYRDIKAPCNSLAEFIWKDVDKWSSHTAIVRFHFYFDQASCIISFWQFSITKNYHKWISFSAVLKLAKNIVTKNYVNYVDVLLLLSNKNNSEKAKFFP